MDGQGQRQWSAPSRTNGFDRRDRCSYSAGHFAPKNAFLMLYGTAVAGMLFVWLVILNTHLRFRKAMTRERILSLPMRLRAHPFFTIVGILLLLGSQLQPFLLMDCSGRFQHFCFFGVISLLYMRQPHNTRRGVLLLRQRP